MPKIILSRKGFDSSAGGKPSPVYNDKFIPFQIPRADTGMFYKDMTFENETDYLSVMKDLGINQFSECHLDPDLIKDVISDRPDHWRPIFGQSGLAESSLRKEKIS